jgi:tetratricopeptide (TPR) repeat protein
MKRVLLLTLLLTSILWANKLSCNFPQEKLTTLFKKEAKGLELFTVRYMDKPIICQKIPHTNRAVVLATYRGKDGTEPMDEVYLLSLGMAVVNFEKEKVLEYGFYENIAESDAVAIETVEIDTETYVNLSKYQPFGISIKEGVSVAHAHSMFEENLWILELRNNKFKTLLDNYKINSNHSMCEGYRICHGEDVMVKKVALCKRKNYCPIFLKSYATSFYSLPITDDAEPIEKEDEKPFVSKLVFKNGKYVEVKTQNKQEVSNELTFKEVEQGAKKGKHYSRYELAKLIYELLYVEGEFKQVRELNDIAYYLQKAGHKLEAVMLLEVLLKEFPKRTVAYYNLADAYWALGRKNEAMKMYGVYVEQMKVKGRGKRIPKVILKRIGK